MKPQTTIFEPSLRDGLLFKTEVRPSTVEGAGLGCFSLENVPRGEWVGMDFIHPDRLSSDTEIAGMTAYEILWGWRHIEHIAFLPEPGRVAADIMNHSVTPNILWHIGFYFTRQEIRIGEELFLDYRYLVSPLWDYELVDGVTRCPLEPFEWRDMLTHSTKQLIELLSDSKAQEES